MLDLAVPMVEVWFAGAKLGEYASDVEALKAASFHADSLPLVSESVEYELRLGTMKYIVHRRITGPDAPALGPVLTISSTELTLTLDRPASGPTRIDYYVIQRYRASTLEYITIASGLDIFDPTNTYADTGLTASTAYYYRCKAVDTTARSSVWSYSAGITSAGAANQAPVWGTVATLPVQAGSSVDVSSYATDPEDDQLTFSKVSATSATITVSAGGVVSTTAATPTGAQSIVVRADDGALTADKTINLTVSAVSSGNEFFIGTGVTEYNAAAVQPGDTITISRGTGSRVLNVIRNAVGNALNPITIRPDPTGRTTIRRSAPGGGGGVCILENCHHVIVDGYMAGQTRSCGLRVMYAIGSTTANKDGFNNLIAFDATAGAANTLTDDITIRYVELDGGWSLATPLSGEQVGSGIFTNKNAFSRTANPGEYQENITIEYCYIHDVPTEGIYCGPNYSNGHVPLRNITIRYNYVTGCGYSGINGKLWLSGTNAIHDNTVLDCGFNPTTVRGQFTGIALLSGAASVYNNFVSGCGESGLKVYNLSGPPSSGTVPGYTGDFSPLVSYFYNNVSVNNGSLTTVEGGTAAVGHGISVAAEVGIATAQAYVFNNTCVSNEGDGVNFNNQAEDGWARNNILLANRAPYALGSGGPTQANNLTTGTPASVFVAPGSNDYHLLSEKAAVGTPGTDISTTDIEGTSRAGTASKGAYEFS